MIRILTALALATLLFTSCGSAGDGPGSKGTPGMTYMEKVIDGRVYVAGTEEGIAKLGRGEKFHIARTQIGAGPDGMSIVYEVDKDDEQLDERLEKEYALRNK